MSTFTHLSPLLSVFSPASDTDQDAAVKLDQERAEIVAKYDKVRFTLPPVSSKKERNSLVTLQLTTIAPSCGRPQLNKLNSSQAVDHNTVVKSLHESLLTACETTITTSVSLLCFQHFHELSNSVITAQEPL